MNRAQLLLQVELTLILEQRAAHIILDLAFEAQQLDLAGQRHRQLIEQHAQRLRLEQALADFEFHAEVRGHQARLLFRRFRAADQTHHFIRQSAVQRDVFLERRHGAARLTLFVLTERRGVERKRLHVRLQMRAGHRVPRDFRTRERFDQHTRRPVLQT